MRFVQAGVLLLGAVMYSVLIALNRVLNYQPDDIGWNLAIVGIWNLLLLVIFILAIVDSARKLSAKRTRQLGTGALVVKLASVPFFVLNFGVLFLMYVLGIGFFLFGGVIVGFAATIGTVLTYLTMLSTSVYVWATIGELRRERRISIGLTILYSILSLLFVGDIAVGVLVFGHSRSRPRLALVALLLAGGLTFVGIGVAGLLWYGGFTQNNDQYRTAFAWTVTAFITVMIIGAAGIVATGIVAFVRRSSLRLEAQQARAVSTSTANG